MMNVLFISHSDFRSNSLTHIASFASGLTKLGHTCAVAVPSKAHTITAVPSPAFRPLLYADILKKPACFPNGGTADIIHAWTPRHHVAACTIAYQRLLARPARLIVHLEDNEEHLTEQTGGMPLAALREAGPAAWESLLKRQLAHPWLHRLFLHAADAITYITPALFQFVPAGIPSHLLLPAVDPTFFAIGPADIEVRRALALPEAARLVVYPGGANPFTCRELRDLYQAVMLLNNQGHCTRLIRTGASPAWFLEQLTPEEHAAAIHLGFVDRERIPGLLALADVLVQPGQRGAFNDYRLPSKLAEFLAAGRPVVMPATNIASQLTNGRDALFLYEGSSEEIAARCLDIFVDPELAQRLGQNARIAARRLFDPDQQSQLLAEIYHETIAQPTSVVSWSAPRNSNYDETALFPSTVADPELQEILNWVRSQPAPSPTVWCRLLSCFRSKP